ncbi:chemotaxis protein CheW [Ekhidna sp.]
MALGKNLKRKKLIEDDKPSVKPKTAKKKVVAKKKELIKKPKATVKKPATKKVSSSKTSVKKTPVKKKIVRSPKVPIPKSEPEKESVQVGLPIYIAQELYALKTQLRERYKHELLELKGKMIQFVVFEVGGESYAIDIEVIKEVVPMPPLSKTPNTPDHINGIANIRGNTYTVFNLAKKFKVSGDEVAKFLLVLSDNDTAASLMISTLPVTVKINGDQISGSMQMIEAASLDVSYIKGIIQHEEKLLYYLDVIELLKNDKAIVVPDKLSKE